MKKSVTSKPANEKSTSKLGARRPRGGVPAVSGVRAGRFVIDGLDKASERR